MKTISILILIICSIGATSAFAQDRPLSDKEQDTAEAAFKSANTLMEQKKFAEALVKYKEVLAILPDDASVLFNGGLAAYQSKDYTTALGLWKHLKSVDPLDWHLRAKLVQTYQALGKIAERDSERAELFEMWKKGDPAELKEQFEYCRDQFEAGGRKVMAFEHFELKGERALRYVFSIVNEKEGGEEYRISLGSYDLDNKIWHEMTKPTPKETDRLFHLDGYFKGGHATHGMYTTEPTFDQTRAIVIQILEGKAAPKAQSTYGKP